MGETAPTWARAVARLAEWIARSLWRSTPKPTRQGLPAKRLTQAHKRQAKGEAPLPPAQAPPKPPAVCRDCCAPIRDGKTFCASCGVVFSREGMIKATRIGRTTAHSPEARARQAEKQRRNQAALKRWNPTQQPDWLTEKYYREEIQPRLARIIVSAIASSLGWSQPYAAEIRKGRQRPHPRHWMVLARLVSVSQD